MKLKYSRVVGKMTGEENLCEKKSKSQLRNRKLKFLSNRNLSEVKFYKDNVRAISIGDSADTCLFYGAFDVIKSHRKKLVAT
jgi:hypothetical protein